MRLIDADYVLSALGIFSDRENGNEHFLNGIETAREIVQNAPTAQIADILKLFQPFPAGYCATCARNSDHNDHFTRCPIEEHYAVPADGYCHLYEEFSPIKKKETDF